MLGALQNSGIFMSSFCIALVVAVKRSLVLSVLSELLFRGIAVFGAVADPTEIVPLDVIVAFAMFCCRLFAETSEVTSIRDLVATFALFDCQ